jgi:sensor histidine kinase regulating citrate/malate metabolism
MDFKMNIQEIKNQNEKLAIKIWNEYKSSYGNRIRDIDNIYIRRLVMGAINQATLKGIKLQMEDEMSFLEDLSEEYWNKHFSMVINKIDNKIKELKQEIKDGN